MTFDYYSFILIQWKLGVYTSTQIANCVTKNYITQAQADIILATPQA